MRVRELNGVRSVRDTVMDDHFMHVVIIQGIVENIDDVHQSFDDRGAAEQKGKPAKRTMFVSSIMERLLPDFRQ